MTAFIGVLCAFISGIITMPVLTELVFFILRQRLKRHHSKQIQEMNRGHQALMTELEELYDKNIDAYNKKLSEMKKKLRGHNLFLEIDENGNEVLIRRAPIRSRHKDWMCRQR